MYICFLTQLYVQIPHIIMHSYCAHVCRNSTISRVLYGYHVYIGLDFVSTYGIAVCEHFVPLTEATHIVQKFKADLSVAELLRREQQNVSQSTHNI